MTHTRRRFLELMGATVAAAPANPLSRMESLIQRQAKWQDPIEERIPSICQLCPGGCGLRVRTVAGIPVKIDGNPFHPVNRGALCPRGQAALQSLYHPDRIKAPFRCAGPKGSGEWERISWDEALAFVTDSLMNLRKKGSPEGLVILGGQYRGLIDRLWARFAAAFGTPNYIRVRNLKPEIPDPVAFLMHGASRPITFDLREAAFILSFGCNWLEGWNSPVHQMQAYGYMRQGRPGNRTEVVHMGPRLSYSAAKSDRWIPVNPATAGVLALGLAHLILREELYDDDFISGNCFGFENWVDSSGRTQPGFKQLVLAEYAPVRVSEITGVSPETIITLARRFAQSRPSIALFDDRSLLEGSDLFTRMATHSLNALVGSVGARGGVLPGEPPPPLTPWPEISMDEVAERGAKTGRLDADRLIEGIPGSDHPGKLPDLVLDSESSPIQILFLYRADPLYGRPDKERFRDALQKIPLVVSFSSFPDAASEYSDLILPEHHFLESWLDDTVNFLPGFSLFSVGRPTIQPLCDTRHVGDVILSLAEGIGGNVALSFPWESYENLLRLSAQGLFEANRGFVVTTPSDEILREVFRRQGYRLPEFEAFDRFWEALIQRGAWWEPAQAPEGSRRRFGTPSGQFEFYPQVLESSFRDGVLTGAFGIKPPDGRIFFPQILTAQKDESDGDFPFLLRTYQLLTIGPGVGARIPWLQENPAAHVDATWQSWIEIHPESARELEVREGDWVWVESPTNRLRVRTRIFSGTMKDVVSLPVGQGHTVGGQWSRNRGVDPSDLIQRKKDPAEAFGIGTTTRVRVYRA